MSGMVINPGTGPVEGATVEQATVNIAEFVQDLARANLTFTRDEAADREGRFGFALSNGIRVHEVRMPGLPIEQVRYRGEAGQDIWDYPRLYVDGSSWVWCYALSALGEDGKWEREVKDA